MINQSTIDKLIEMHLTVMADALRIQLNDPKMKEITFEYRLGMLVDVEYCSRKNNRLKRLIRGAEFDQPDASIMDINYTSGRKLNRELIRRLASCEYTIEHHNLFITGAQHAVVRPTWLVHLAWKPVSNIIKLNMCVFRIFSLILKWQETREITGKGFPSIQIQCCLSLMDGFY